MASYKQKFTLIWLSIAIHLLVFAFFRQQRREKIISSGQKPAKTLQVKIITPPIPKQIIEAEQEETEKPQNPSHLGRQDHQAVVETKTVARQKKRRDNHGQLKPQRKMIPEAKGNKTSYEQFLQDGLGGSYEDFVHGDMKTGEAIDISTSEYRYIGYFSGLRKAIDLVWTYPSQAVHSGQQGVVKLRFAIDADGTASKIKVTQSSGYRILDVAIVDAIKLASPFSPLPTDMGENKIFITGSFWYILNGI